jgi:hypothetical protein
MYSQEKSAQSGTVSAESTQTQNGYGTRSARSSATFGVLRVFAEGHSVANGSTSGLMSSGAQASWQDSITVDAPGLSGQAGTLTVQFTIDGSLTASGQFANESLRPYAAAEFTFTRDGWTILEGYQAVYSDGWTPGTPFLGQPQTATFNFVFGTPFEIKLFIETVARAYTYQHSADAEGDLANTATWGGFVAVKDSNENLITNFTASSASGANYAHAIVPPKPEMLIRRTGSDVQVSWSTNFSNYTLETSDTLAPDSWNAVTNAVQTVGTDWAVTLSPEDGARYFRLRQ